jgi:hypothetical protein
LYSTLLSLASSTVVVGPVDDLVRLIISYQRSDCDY